jgi:hypothetical protein
LQALLIVLSHFGAAYLVAAVFLPASGAFLVGLGAATFAALIYLGLIATGIADEGLPLGLLYLSPIIYLTVALLWWTIRLILTALGQWPPRF